MYQTQKITESSLTPQALPGKGGGAPLDGPAADGAVAEDVCLGPGSRWKWPC